MTHFIPNNEARKAASNAVHDLDKVLAAIDMEITAAKARRILVQEIRASLSRALGSDEYLGAKHEAAAELGLGPAAKPPKGMTALFDRYGARIRAGNVVESVGDVEIPTFRRPAPGGRVIVDRVDAADGAFYADGTRYAGYHFEKVSK